MSSAPRICHQCQSTSSELRAKTAVNGAVMVAYQCCNCGHKVGNWIPHSTLPMPVSSLPRWDESLADEWHESQRQHSHVKAQELAKIRDTLDAQWWADYAAYLKTPRWESIRAQVIQRDGGWCKGCNNEPATQVHHLTYAHVGHEFLWELISVCDACHDRVHGPQPAVTP